MWMTASAPISAAPRTAVGTAAPRTAVLLVNLGTPDAPTASAVRRYLAEFLHDYRVVSLSRWLWCPILHGVILPLRGPKVAKKYAEVWLPGGSPLAVHTADLAAAMQARMPDVRVVHAMRYGNPSMDSAVAALRAEGVTEVVVLPLYPQYSTTTTASVADKVEMLEDGARDDRMPNDGMPNDRIRDGELDFRFIDDYHLDPAWVAAVADSIRAHWAEHGRGERLMFSFHGIPQRLVDAGDPYQRQVRASVDAIVAALGIGPDDALLTFQSRFGREPWLQPYTDKTLQALAAQGVKRIDVVCPGFAVDCLETLEEITVENAHLFREAGGETLRYIPCLNASPAHADALAALARRHLRGAA